MSRIGRNPIVVPKNVEVLIEEGFLFVNGVKGSLNFKLTEHIDVNLSEGEISLNRNSEVREIKSLHGTTRQIINNMVIGVSDGFSKELEIVGVGYQANAKNNRLHLQLGFSHDIYFDMPEGISITANRTEIKVEGIDKQLVGAVSAKIRSFRPPEPYKGKGIRYKNEYVRTKQGKTVGAK
tara:strand:+ start:93 stop:632 length:540 start_codon:yes stop_codon:yes gene_type:complete